MASKLKAIPSPHIQKMEEKIVETIEQLMRNYLDESSKMGAALLERDSKSGTRIEYC
jgi:hypothetical protein